MTLSTGTLESLTHSTNVQVLPHLVAVLALDDVVLPDLAQPLGIFGNSAHYEVRLCGPKKSIRTKFADMKLEWGLDQLGEAGTIIVPGLERVDGTLPRGVLDALRMAHKNGTRIVSICSGAFVLAKAGVLDGLRATTHWRIAGELAARFPRVDVDQNVLFTDNGQVLCSAGATAGTDLCLHIVRKDLGAAAAMGAARMAVAPLAREGNQAQFIKSETNLESGRLDSLLDWLQANLHRRIAIRDMAHHARMSERTINRRFREQTGTTPLNWLQGARIREAQYLLEASTLSVEEITSRTGFVTASTLRQRFLRKVGVSPSAYRRAFCGERDRQNPTIQSRTDVQPD